MVEVVEDIGLQVIQEPLVEMVVLVEVVELDLVGILQDQVEQEILPHILRRKELMVVMEVLRVNKLLEVVVVALVVQVCPHQRQQGDGGVVPGDLHPQ